MVERERVKASLRAYALPERSDGEVEIERSEIVRGVATRNFFLGCLLLLAMRKPPQAVRPAGVSMWWLFVMFADYVEGKQNAEHDSNGYTVNESRRVCCA